MGRSERGYYVEITIPDSEAAGLKWPELAQAGKEYRRTVAEWKATLIRQRNLEEDRPKAVERDRKALAKAIKEGGPELGAKNVEKLDMELAACRRRLDAIDDLLAEAEAAVEAAVEAHRDAWAAQAEDEKERARGEALQALEALSERLTMVSKVSRVEYWVRGFPDRKMGAGANLGYAPGLISRNGEPHHLTAVIDSLRALLAPAPTVPAEPQEEAA